MPRRIEIKEKSGGVVENRVLQKTSEVVQTKGQLSVKLMAARADVAAVERHGGDLLIRFKDGSVLLLDGYFECAPGEGPDLVLGEADGAGEWKLMLDDAACQVATNSAGEALPYSFAQVSGEGSLTSGAGFVSDDPGGGGALLPVGLGALAVGGLGAAAGGGGGGGGGNNPPPTGDTTPPAAPTIQPTNGTVVRGTAEANARLNIDADGNGTTDATVNADASGNWTYTPSTPIANGTTIRVTASDAAGNTSPPATTVVDAAPPPVPVIGAVTDDVGALTGAVANGGATDDALPTISGSGMEAGATVSVFDNNVLLGTTTATASGAWSFTPTTALADGAHSFTATARDALGNTSAASAPHQITIDTAAPAAPAIGTVTDDVALGIGAVANGGVTNDNQPAISGTGAEAGAVISIFDGGTLLGTATASSGGGWSFTPPTALVDGSHSLTTTATDTVGNTGPASAPFVIVVDTAAPAAPVIAPTDGTVIGGTAEPGATVNLDIGSNGTVDATVTTDAQGNWRYTPPAPLADDTAISATATDPAGNTSPAVSAMVDIAALPPPPVISAVNDDVAPVTGVVAGGGRTNDALPTVTGTGAGAGATVTVFDNGAPIGVAIANAAGAWSLTPALPLAEGAHSFTATTTSLLGPTSAQSGAYAVTVDLTGPTVPTIASITDDVAPVTGTVASGGATNDARPTLAGTGVEAGATVSVFDNGALIGTTVAGPGGGWSFTPAAALGDGGHSFTVTASDAAGNASAPSAAYAVTVDTAAPAATITITAVNEDTGVAGDFITADTSPTVAGTLGAPLAAGERVEVRLDGAGPWVTATTNGTSWFYGFGAVSAGAHTIEARVVDAAGNLGNGDTQALTIADTNRAPLVQVDETALLGLISAEALGLIDLNDQSLVAIDPDNNLASVVVRFAPVLNLGNYTLTSSEALATELGLDIAVVNDPGLLGVLAPSSQLTITAIGGGPMDNQAVNELLATVHFEQSALGISAQVLAATTITATDTNGTSASAVAGTLADLSLLQPAGDTSIVTGSTLGETVLGLALNERLYGFDGNDTVDGGAGNDLLRGGQGLDILIGGLGEDVLVYDALDLAVDGGDGFDTLLVDSATALGVNDGTLSITNIERIDLGIADLGVDLTLTEGGVLAANVDGELYVTGGPEDTVTLTGGVLQGQVLVGDTAYSQYALGAATLFIESSVVVG